LFLLGTATGVAAQEDGRWSTGGHVKAQFNDIGFPDNSIYRQWSGSSAQDYNLESRLKFSYRRDRWDFKADYQFIMLNSDSLRLSSQLPSPAVPGSGVISDDRRWWDLTYSVGDIDDTVFIHRLDRLSAGFTTDHTVWRFGRQAISWGNGLIFSPMDIFNPFDPAAVDKEYKSGDDMLYGQYLFDSGNDLQGVAVVRRDPVTGDVEQEQSSVALKYHGFIGMNEFDLLAARHYDDTVLGLGGGLDVGGAVVRGDLTWTDTNTRSVFSAVASLSYSWTWAGKNVSGVLEYYYNGFGQADSAYSGAELAANPDLLRRIARGELFTLARHYTAASAMIEVTPLFRLTPNLFVNLEDPSALVQVVAQYDWRQNLQVLAALNIPAGSGGTEYGGIETPIDGLYFSTDASLFAQLAWYF
jgi:hypothetical protein